jgi:uncharacterized protein (DUF1697 family)
MQSVITKMREDNEHLVKSLKKAYEDRQALNSRILVLQQVTLENEHKESEAIQHLNKNIQSLKQLIDRQQVIIDQKEKSFIDLYSLSIQRIPKNDKQFYIKVQDLLKTKQKIDLQALNVQPASVSNLIKEKEKL